MGGKILSLTYVSFPFLYFILFRFSFIYLFPAKISENYVLFSAIRFHSFKTLLK